MDVEIKGTTMPVLEMKLQPGESIVAESGELSWLTASIQLRTTTQTAGSKGLMGVLKRAVAGASIFMTEYTAGDGPGMVAFATRLPGEILPVQIQPGGGVVIQKHGFLCGTPGIELGIAFQKKLGAGIFGGEGFVLQKLTGTGDAWVELDGEMVMYDLGQGETLRVHPGHIGMFQEQVTFDLTTVPGIKNKLFGGDGLFLGTLTGPGRVWLQSLTIANLAEALKPYLPQPSEGGSSGGGFSFSTD